MLDVDGFLAASGWHDATRSPLVGDASRRRYERVSTGRRNAVMMISPPEIDPSLPRFLTLTHVLRSAGLSAPDVYAADTDRGLALLEDLGDNLFSRASGEANATEMLCAAADVIVAVSSLDTPAPTPTPDDLIAALAPARDWVPGVDVEQFDAFTDLLRPLLEALDTTPRALALRDYHAGNLLWLPERHGIQRVGLLDYQDAFRTHPVYDLVSLLEDVRQVYSSEAVRAARKTFARQLDMNEDDLAQAFAVMTVQRNTRILGVFCRLALRDRKIGYLDFLSATHTSIRRALSRPDLRNAADVFARAVPEPDPAYVRNLKDQCTTDPALP